MSPERGQRSAVLYPCDRKEVPADLLEARFTFYKPRGPEEPLAGCGIGLLVINVGHEERGTLDSVDRLN